MRAEEGNIFTGGAALGKAGGGLDIIGAGTADNAAQRDLFLVGQKAGLNDDLEDFALAGRAHGFDLVFNRGEIARLGGAHVDHHINFVRAVLHSVGGFKHFCGGGHVAVGEADHCANAHRAAEVILRLPHKAGGNADARRAKAHRVVADGFDLFPGRVHSQKRVVAVGKNRCFIHRHLPFGSVCFQYSTPGAEKQEFFI